MQRLELSYVDSGGSVASEAEVPPADGLGLLVRNCLAVLIGHLQAASAIVDIQLEIDDLFHPGSAQLRHNRDCSMLEMSCLKWL